MILSGHLHSTLERYVCSSLHIFLHCLGRDYCTKDANFDATFLFFLSVAFRLSIQRQNKQIVGGLSLVTGECLITLKAKAFIDLFTRKKAGEQSIDTRNIRKHQNDIARIVAGLPGKKTLLLPGALREDMDRFLQLMEVETIDMKSLNLPFTQEDFLERMRQIFSL